MMPRKLESVLRPYFRSNTPAKQGHIDRRAQAWVFYLRDRLEALISREGEGYYITFVDTRDGSSFGDGVYRDTWQSARRLETWVAAELAA